MIRTYYRPLMAVEKNESYSPSAGKPSAFVNKAIKEKSGIQIHIFDPVSAEDLMLVHDREYVVGVLTGLRSNGFGNRNKRVADACRYTTGSMVAAALDAGASGQIVCSPTSGFHHAGYSHGGGFCTFNGLAVAAAKYLASHPQAKIGIIDCDYHYGDGTDEILRSHPQLKDQVLHFTSGQHFGRGDDAGDFFDWLNDAIDAINDAGCEVVLYQAGGDIHIADPLGGLLTTEEMIRRDELVFGRVKCGIAWNLAGGYQRDEAGGISTVVNLHMNTLQAAVEAAKARGQ